MSDEDKDSKSEDPTDKKISDTLEKGNVPFSREVTNVFSILAVTLVIFFYVPQFANGLVKVGREVFANSTDWSLATPEDVVNLGSYVVVGMGFLLMPFVLPILLFGVVASIIQNRPRVVLDRIQPKPNRLSLTNGLKRLLGKQALKEFFKSMFKFTAAGIASALVLFSQMDWVISHLLVEAVRMPATIHTLVVQACVGVTFMMVLLAMIDFVWVRREWFENIRMSHKEIKDERKQADGDPIVKARSLSLARDRARNRMLSNVAQATLVVANPTHFSIAMRYDPEIDHAPFVLAKGQDNIALKIRGIAEENDIPVIEDKPLARSLYKACSVDQVIPVEFYVPIAHIVRTLSEKG